MLALGVSLEIVPVNLLIHAGLFLVVLTVMTRFLLKPVSRVFAERDGATTERQARATTITTDAAQLEASYRERMTSVHNEARELKEVLRRDGFSQAATVMAQARTRAAAQLDQAKQELQAAAQQARAMLQTDARQFGQLIAERILERTVQVHEEMVRESVANEVGARKAN